MVLCSIDRLVYPDQPLRSMRPSASLVEQLEKERAACCVSSVPFTLDVGSQVFVHHWIGYTALPQLVTRSTSSRCRCGAAV